MLGASRASIEDLRGRLDAIYADPSQRDGLAAAGTGVLTVLDAADDERSLRDIWADHATPESVKDGVLEQLFGERIPRLSREVAKQVVSARWSSDVDMMDSLEEAGASLVLMSAEATGRLDRVEEELFRFGRAVDANADLQMALTDPATDGSTKAGIVSSLLDGKSEPVTEELLVHTAAHLRGRRIQAAITALSALAATRRDRVVAEVTAATELDDDQKRRLAAALSKIRGRTVQLNVTVDPAVIGGIQVQVGDEVIDGTLATRLQQARRRLAG